MLLHTCISGLLIIVLLAVWMKGNPFQDSSVKALVNVMKHTGSNDEYKIIEFEPSSPAYTVLSVLKNINTTIEHIILYNNSALEYDDNTKFIPNPNYAHIKSMHGSGSHVSEFIQNNTGKYFHYPFYRHYNCTISTYINNKAYAYGSKIGNLFLVKYVSNDLKTLNDFINGMNKIC